VRANARAVKYGFCGSEPDGGRRGGVPDDLSEQPERVFD
jgi:hypothetical protein